MNHHSGTQWSEGRKENPCGEPSTERGWWWGTWLGNNRGAVQAATSLPYSTSSHLSQHVNLLRSPAVAPAAVHLGGTQVESHVIQFSLGGGQTAPNWRAASPRTSRREGFNQLLWEPRAFAVSSQNLSVLQFPVHKLNMSVSDKRAISELISITGTRTVC